MIVIMYVALLVNFGLFTTKFYHKPPISFAKCLCPSIRISKLQNQWLNFHEIQFRGVSRSCIDILQSFYNWITIRNALHEDLHAFLSEHRALLACDCKIIIGAKTTLNKRKERFNTYVMSNIIFLQMLPF
jgi:hypothetical protein